MSRSRRGSGGSSGICRRVPRDLSRWDRSATPPTATSAGGGRCDQIDFDRSLGLLALKMGCSLRQTFLRISRVDLNITKWKVVSKVGWLRGKAEGAVVGTKMIGVGYNRSSGARSDLTNAIESKVE